MDVQTIAQYNKTGNVKHPQTNNQTVLLQITNATLLARNQLHFLTTIVTPNPHIQAA